MSISNKAAYHSYFIEQKYTAGMVLTGTEVKSLRAGKASFNDAFCFFHEGEFYTREYVPEKNRLVLKANTPAESLIIEDVNKWECWGVVMLTLNPTLQPQQRTGRYGRVCTC